MKKPWLMALFLVLAVGQIAAPVSMIVQREQVLKDGRLYKFPSQPIDPVDVFRGRYVALSLRAAQEVYSTPAWNWEDRTAYARIKVDEAGFAHFDNLTSAPPPSGDYVKARVHYGSLVLPFSRYYMNEKLAPKAESEYWKHMGRRGSGQIESYAAVRVLRGNAVLEDLYIGGKPVAEFLDELPKSP
ncbi:MAG: GDYXXLXY domain-containing protein [Candidatus Hydrogenedentes bacterium]|nr:GDYXXLXY domain-containing protein [Candidatus Hydrogenedentota bacterium]